ncbi:MAG: hypothetical protein CNIPEHKO_00904 [Anaerolineales bacterium]|nr:hypothetical protein [Anaerolineales bacterium]
MLLLLKTLAVAVAAGVFWLVGQFTLEYFRPYKRN